MLQFLFSPTKQFLYDSGKLLAGGKIFVYIKDTENLANLYNVNGEYSPNPIVLDANGRASIKADDTYEYRLEIYTPYNTLLYTANAFYAGNGEGGSGGEFIVRHDVTLSGNGTSQSPLGVINIPLAVDDTMTARVDDVEGTEALILGVNGDWFNSTFSEALSSKLGVDTFSAYSANVNNTLSTKLDTSSLDLSNYYNKTDVDLLLANKVNNDTFTNVVQNLDEAKENTIEFGYDSLNQISSINNSAIAGGTVGVTFPITGTDGNYDYSAEMDCSAVKMTSTIGNGNVIRLTNENAILSRYMVDSISASWADIIAYSKAPTISSIALATATTSYSWNRNELNLLNEVHITTPHNYDGPSTYDVNLGLNSFVLNSGVKVDFIKQDIGGNTAWCVSNSSTYEV